MTRDEILAMLLLEKEIYPPSVLDIHYGDTPEMTRAEIIEKTLRAMGILLASGKYAPSREEERDLNIVVTELQRRLPLDTRIRTCAAFEHLNAGCCNSCHTYRPHFSMELIELPGGGNAWVCCAIKRAIFPELYAESIKRFAERMEQCWNSPQMKRWRERFGGGDRREN